MIFAFGFCELDTTRHELRREGELVTLEPQVFALLLLLVRERERLLTRDDIIGEIWNGRFVSDSAVSSRIKSARRAIGDDGRAQRLIRTHHGQGFRFVGEVVERHTIPARTSITQAPERASTGEMPSGPAIAVLPFQQIGVAGPYAGMADALPHELIAQFSRLRWLFVIARGSSFQFRSGDPDIRAIGAALGVAYLLTGSVEPLGSMVAVTVELADARTGGVVWSDRFQTAAEDIHAVRQSIVASVLAAVEIRIPASEAERASRLSAPQHLGAWDAYHLGLRHMYRFNSRDNQLARGMFERAVALEPRFARAHAGLSFTSFQEAFLRYSPDVAGKTQAALRHAERSVELDPLDPFANYTMGRAQWLRGDIGSGLGWLGRATDINPNYAQANYARGMLDTLAGRREGRDRVDLAMRLSPLDPLHYAMLATMGISCLIQGDARQAAVWADRAANAPGAHHLIRMIAVAAHESAGDRDRAARWAASLSESSVTQDDFFRSFPIEDSAARGIFSRGFAAHGL